MEELRCLVSETAPDGTMKDVIGLIGEERVNSCGVKVIRSSVLHVFGLEEEKMCDEGVGNHSHIFCTCGAAPLLDGTLQLRNLLMVEHLYIVATAAQWWVQPMQTAADMCRRDLLLEVGPR